MTQDEAPQFATAEFEPTLADSHPLFLRGVLFGAAGAVLGLVLYSTVGIVTGYAIGFVSLAVGWIVGTMVVKGSKGRTGRRYQIAAALLTYFAVSMSAIPIGIHYIVKHPDAIKTETARDRSGAAIGAPTVTESRQDSSAAPQTVSVAAVVGTLVIVGLASPFIELTGMSGLIGLLILSIGIRIAWRITGGRPAAVQAAMVPPRPNWPPGSSDTPTTLGLNR